MDLATGARPRPWALLGAPLDSAGASRGERRAPGALRAAGLAEAIGALDLGDADGAVLDDSVRDPATGIVGFENLVRASGAVRHRVGEALDGGHRPLVLGGDCSILLGVVAALRDRHERIGLWFLDGHADFYDGRTSPTGEGADMELAILTGHGPPGLVDLAPPPLVAAADVVLLGHRRPEEDPDVAEELSFLPDDLFHLDATTILRSGATRVGAETEQRLARRVGRTWLHLDLDVLDETALPAVTYPQAGGLGWDDLAELMTPLLSAPTLLGLSLADLDPDLDPDGRHTRRVVDLLARSLRGGGGPERPR